MMMMFVDDVLTCSVTGCN